MHIQADRFLALTAKLAGFVPRGPGDAHADPRGERVDEVEGPAEVDAVHDGDEPGAPGAIAG